MMFSASKKESSKKGIGSSIVAANKTCFYFHTPAKKRQAQRRIPHEYKV
jgi:hypothetical protein